MQFRLSAHGGTDVMWRHGDMLGLLGILLWRARVRVPAVGIDAYPLPLRPAQELVDGPVKHLALDVP